MSLHDLFGVGLVLLGLWLSAVASALAEASRSGIEARTSVRPQRLDQLLDARERARLAARALATMGLLAGVLLLTSNLDLTKGILAVLLGIVAVVVAESFARHAPEATAASGLRAVAMADAGLVALRPLILILDEAARRLTGANLRTGEDEEEAEFRRHIEDSQRRGGLDERGASLVENAVEFGSAEVHEIMTPRIEIDGIMLTDDLEALTESLHEVQHSRVPVYRESLDDIVGVLHVRDLLPYLGPRSKPIDLESMLRQPLIVPETMPVADLLAAFRDQGIRFAVVVDEYGGTAGIASAEDVLSELVGELETPESDGIEVHDSYIEVEGWVHVDELNDRFELDIPEDDDYETVAGYLLAALGRVPDARESYTCEAGRTFNITHATPTTIERIRILRNTTESDA